MSCCWARTVLAMPAGAAMPPQMPCQSDRCAMGDCRKCRDSGSGTDPAQRLQELLDSARLEHPDPQALTERILERLAEQAPDEPEADD